MKSDCASTIPATAREAEVLRAFACCLRYPVEGSPARGGELVRLAMAIGDTVIRDAIGEARDTLGRMGDCEIEESFTRTFDINPAVASEVGFQLFGLAYQRGAFLVKIKEALVQYGIDPGAELADHLTVMLELAAAMIAANDERGTALIEECIAPAVKRMADGFDGADNPWGALVNALWRHIETNYRPVPFEFGETDHDWRDACEL